MTMCNNSNIFTADLALKGYWKILQIMCRQGSQQSEVHPFELAQCEGRANEIMDEYGLILSLH